MSNHSDLPSLPDMPSGLYQHHKGSLYEVLGVARHSETLTPMVLYRPVAGDGTLWVRPFDMFHEDVMVNGTLTPRFKRLPDQMTQ